jgi:TonB-dependent SusC/RagA subfamily outer membrane receptor
MSPSKKNEPVRAAIAFQKGEEVDEPFSRTGGAMSLSSHHVSFGFAGLLVSSALIVSTSACYHAPSAAPDPIVAAELTSLKQSINSKGFHQFPGVDVVPTGQSAFLVRIHSGLVGAGDPLYIIDGAPTIVDSARGIDWFKPDDIAAIQVLKSPEDLAIYGPRGVNGVIVITTRQAAGRSRGT